MSRDVVPLPVPDLSVFTRALARSLHAALAEDGKIPSHQTLMNLVVRAAGHRNVQALRASASEPRLGRPVAPPPPLTPHARKMLEHFDEAGRLARWPSKFSVQRLAVWVLWMPFESKRLYREREVDEFLKRAHTYGDHVTLRRELVNHGLLGRERDGSVYWKLTPRPDPEAHAAMRAWRAALARPGASGARSSTGG